MSAVVVTEKRCSKCGEVKGVEMFGVDKRAGDGLQSKCKACNAEYRRANRGRKAEYDAEYRRANRERISKRRAEYRRANRERIAEYRRANRERYNKQKAEYYRANRERILEQKAEYYRANREQYAEYRRANRERYAEYNAEYRRANPHVVAKSNANRRARLRDALVESVDPRDIFTRDNGICYLCQESADVNDWHLEHIIPLSGEGVHMALNLAVSHPACNLAKGTKSVDETVDAFPHIDMDRVIDALNAHDDVRAESDLEV